MGKISRVGNRCTAPDIVTIPYIDSDEPVRDIIAVCQVVADAAVRMAYRGKRFIKWTELLAGEKANAYTGEHLPQDTIETIKKYAYDK